MPTCVINPNPSNGATNVPEILTISWSPVSSAEYYDLYFGTNPNPPYLTTITQNSYDLGVLNSNTTYYWKVIPKNNCGYPRGCLIWSFTTGCTIPSPASNPSPGDNEIDVIINPILSWSSDYMQIHTIYILGRIQIRLF